MDLILCLAQCRAFYDSEAVEQSGISQEGCVHITVPSGTEHFYLAWDSNGNSKIFTDIDETLAEAFTGWHLIKHIIVEPLRERADTAQSA